MYDNEGQENLRIMSHATCHMPHAIGVWRVCGEDVWSGCVERMCGECVERMCGECVWYLL